VDTILEAGCPPGGLVCDPFIGRGTTGIVAVKRKLNYVGFDLSLESCELARKNIESLYLQ
jgi:DNA modification methylase